MKSSITAYADEPYLNLSCFVGQIAWLGLLAQMGRLGCVLAAQRPFGKSQLDKDSLREARFKSFFLSGTPRHPSSLGWADWTWIGSPS